MIRCLASLDGVHRCARIRQADAPESLRANFRFVAPINADKAPGKADDVSTEIDIRQLNCVGHLFYTNIGK
jgi:hypothetical protein